MDMPMENMVILDQRKDNKALQFLGISDQNRSALGSLTSITVDVTLLLL